LHLQGKCKRCALIYHSLRFWGWYPENLAFDKGPFWGADHPTPDIFIAGLERDRVHDPNWYVVALTSITRDIPFTSRVSRNQPQPNAKLVLKKTLMEAMQICSGDTLSWHLTRLSPGRRSDFKTGSCKPSTRMKLRWIPVVRGSWTDVDNAVSSRWRKGMARHCSEDKEGLSIVGQRMTETAVLEWDYEGETETLEAAELLATTVHKTERGKRQLRFIMDRCFTITITTQKIIGRVCMRINYT